MRVLFMGMIREINDWEIEAQYFANYVTGEALNDQTVALYIRIMQGRKQNESETENRLIHFAHTHPWSIGYLDAGLALTRPNAELRQRLSIMFSILETVPKYADQFLPTQHSKFYILIVMWSGCKAVFKALLGIVFVRFIV